MKRIATFIATLMLAAVFTAAAAPRQYTFDIPRQPLDAALKDFAKQTGLQIAHFSDKIAGGTVGPIKGNYSLDEALTSLLSPSGLTYKIVNERTIAVLKPDARKTGAISPSDAANSETLLARAEPEAAGRTEDDVEEMLVEGARDKPAPFASANLDLTRDRDDALPFTVFTARDIELSGAATLQDFLRNRLPQNFTDDIPEELDGAGVNISNRSAQVNLRGWGSTETVFLLNGRRMPAQYQSNMSDAGNATPNLQSIPVASIERIEILTSAGSAIYGASATGGVINIITRQDFRGGQLAVNYETPADTHAPRRGINFSYGQPFKWNTGLRLSAAYNESEPLRVGDRSDVSVERWRQRVLERQPTRLINSQQGNPLLTSSQILGATPNIRATSTTGNLFDDLTGAPASNFTTVPAGSTGNSSLSAFQPGTYNVQVAEGSAGDGMNAKGSTLGTANTNAVVTLGFDRSFASDWRWSVDYRYTQSESEGRASGSLSLISSNPVNNRPWVPGSAPTNPFGQDVRVLLVDPNLDRPELRNRPRNVSWELSSTLRGALGEWRGFVDLIYSNNRNRYSDQTYWEPGGGWQAAYSSGAYNPFVDPRVRAPADADFYADYIVARSWSRSATHNYRSAIKASGPLWSLPAGALQLTAGVDWARVDRYRSEYFGEFQDGMTGQPRTPVSLPPGNTSSTIQPLENNPVRQFVFDTSALYAETNLPLISSAQNLPLVQRLEVFGSGRLNYSVRRGFYSQSEPDQQNGVPPVPVKYTDTSHIHAFGVGYEMIEGVALRLTRSIGFKPPAMMDITPAESPPTLTLSGFNDPVRGDPVTLTPSMYVTGGNPDLRPETTQSSNVGLIFSPAWMRGLRISVDYLESLREDAIFSLNAQEALNLESEFPSLVRRGPPDGDASGAGEILFVDLRNTNLRQIISKSLDFSVEQQLDNVFGGRMVLTAMATKNLSFKVQASNTGPSVEQIRNLSGAFSRQIEWNANGQLRWEGRKWSMGWSARYYDYLLALTTDYLLQGGDRAPWAVEHDVNVSYRAPALQSPHGFQRLISGTSISFGVRNVLDRAPRFWAASTNRGIVSYDSLMGRSVWLQMRKSFD